MILRVIDVRFGSIADKPANKRDVRVRIVGAGMSAKCHVWTAPSWQELSSRLQHRIIALAPPIKWPANGGIVPTSALQAGRRWPDFRRLTE